MKMRKEREEFRKAIATEILSNENETDDDNHFPNSKERQLLRYYRYISHGINACHIAPISKRVLKK